MTPIQLAGILASAALLASLARRIVSSRAVLVSDAADDAGTRVRASSRRGSEA